MATKSKLNSSRFQRVLITGADGYLGAALTHRLLTEGCEVIAIDRKQTHQLKRLNPHAQNLSYTSADVCHLPIELDPQFAGVQAVFHFAEEIQTPGASRLSLLETNYYGTERVLELAHRIQAPVYFASSSEIYGMNEESPLTTDSKIILGTDSEMNLDYAVSKALAEQLCFAFSEQYNLPIAILRFFDFEGPDSDWFRLDPHAPTSLSAVRTWGTTEDAINGIFAVELGHGCQVFNIAGKTLKGTPTPQPANPQRIWQRVLKTQ